MKIETFQHGLVRSTICLLLFAIGCGESYQTDPSAEDVAKWVLGKGGKISVTTQDLEITNAANLPEPPYGILRVDLNQKEFKEIDLQKLTELKNVKYLGLHSGSLSDKSTSFITSLHTLEELEISYTQISDAGLKEIGEELPNLNRIYLFGTAPSVSDAGVEAFQKQLPNCTVIR